jgi:F-type H+-transporting ATPase subunit b
MVMNAGHGILTNPELWVLVSFCIFLGLFGKTLAKAITGMLDARADSVRATLVEAQRLRSEAEAMLAEAEAARSAAIAEAKQVLARSKTEAERVAAAAGAEARAAAARRERMAMDRINAAEKAAVNEIRALAADIAVAAATQVMAEGLTAEAGATLIDEAIASLPKVMRAA